MREQKGRKDGMTVESRLQESLKELMRQYSFDKITVGMITDRAGVRRPTFYNHFRDKYEVLERIFQNEIGKAVCGLIMDGMHEEAIKVLFLRMEKDRTFYRRAMEITGQNSFEEILEENLCRIFLEGLCQYNIRSIPSLRYWRKEALVKYYATGIINVVKEWLFEDEQEVPAEIIYEGCRFLMTHSIFDLVEKKENP